MQYHILLGKIVGTIYLTIKTEKKEHFLHICQENDITVWKVRQLSENKLSCFMYLHKETDILEIIHNHFQVFELISIKHDGLLPMLKKLLHRQSLIFVCFFCLFLLFILSNVIWKVNISGVNIEHEEEIREYLESSGIFAGAWAFGIPNINELQERILIHLEDLLYVGIEKKGAIIYINATEKKLAKENTNKSYQQLIAKKSGTIDKMLIVSGYPLVHTNDYVNKGDVLVVNKLDIDEEAENGEQNKPINTAVEGEVFATTWYEIKVSTPLAITYEELFGTMTPAYGLGLGKYHINLWPIKQNIYEQQYVEEELLHFNFLQWELPFYLVKNNIYEIKTINKQQTVELAKEYAIQQAINHLQLKLGMKTEIKHYFVLQDKVDNDKVKLNLFVSVLENIAVGN